MIVAGQEGLGKRAHRTRALAFPFGGIDRHRSVTDLEQALETPEIFQKRTSLKRGGRRNGQAGR